MKKCRPSLWHRPSLESLERLELPGSTVLTLLGWNLFYPSLISLISSSTLMDSAGEQLLGQLGSAGAAGGAGGRTAFVGLPSAQGAERDRLFLPGGGAARAFFQALARTQEASQAAIPAQSLPENFDVLFANAAQFDLFGHADRFDPFTAGGLFSARHASGGGLSDGPASSHAASAGGTSLSSSGGPEFHAGGSETPASPVATPAALPLDPAARGASLGHTGGPQRFSPSGGSNEAESAGPTFTWINHSPAPPDVTNPGSQSNAETDTVSLQVTASDPNDRPLRYVATGLPTGLSIDADSGLISGTIAYTAANSFGGSYAATVIVANDAGGSASQTFTWTVNDTDRAPALTDPGNQTNAQNDAVSVQLSATDADGDALTYDATGLPPGLYLGRTSGVIGGTITAGAYADSPYTVTVSATDGTLTDTQMFTWTVTADNHAPALAAPGNQSSAAGQPVSLALAATDLDQDPLTFTATGLPPGLRIDPGSGAISGTLTDTADAGSPYSSAVSASDGAATASQTFTWTVTRVGIGNPGDQANVNGDTVSLGMQATDPGGPSLTYSATSLPSGLSIDSGTGLISGTLSDTADAGSPYTTTVTAGDGTYSGSTSFTWTVAHLALTNPGDRTNIEGGTVSLQLAATDADGATLTYAASGLPTGLSLDASTGLIFGTVDATASANSPYTVTVSAAHGSHSASQTFTWGVTPHVILLPVASQENAAGDLVSLAVVARDAGGQTLTYTAAGLPAGLSIDSATGLISGTPDASAGGTYAVSVAAGAGTFGTTSTFTWAVHHVLVVNPGTQDSTDGDSLYLTLSARDHDGDPLTYTAAGLPPGLSLSSGGYISGTLDNAADTGSPYTVTVTASDGSNSNTQPFTWNVLPHIYVTNPGNQTNVGGDFVSLALTAYDPQGPFLMWSATGLPSGLSLFGSTIEGQISTLAATGSTYTVTVTANDGSHSASQTFTWTVSQVGVTTPSTPVVSPEGEATSFTLSGRDASGNALTYSVSGLPQGLSLDTSSGVISGTIPTTGHVGSPYTVTASVSDGTNSASLTFPWTVIHLDLHNPGDQTTLEGSTVSLTLSATDPDSDPLTYSAGGLPPGLSLDSETGVISGTINPGTTAGAYPVTVAVTDGAVSVQQTFTWTINPYVTLTTPATQNSVEGNFVWLQLQAQDAGGHPLTYSADGLPAGLSINASMGSITGTIASGASANGPYGVAVSAGDGTYSNTQGFVWYVTHATALPPLDPGGGPGQGLGLPGSVEIIPTELTLSQSDLAKVQGLTKLVRDEDVKSVLERLLIRSATPEEYRKEESIDFIALVKMIDRTGLPTEGHAELIKKLADEVGPLNKEQIAIVRRLREKVTDKSVAEAVDDILKLPTKPE